jgi:hypothetical protein
MNSDEVTRYTVWGVAIIGPILVRWGVPSDTANSLIGGVVVAGAQLAPVVGAAAFAIYRGLNKRLVHENAVVTSVAPTVADAKAASIPAGK